jgi:plasmid replication initiation protein
MNQELIVKSNSLLQHPLYKKSVELKLFSRIILSIRNHPNDNIFSFNVKDLLEFFDGGADNYTELKKIAKSMFRVVDLNPAEKGFHLSTIFTDIFTHEEGIITFEINKNIKPYLLDLTNNFTQYYFENIAKLKSSFSIRMYELLKQYESVGSRRVSIQYLKDFLSIESSKFTKYNDFKRFVILVAQKELEDKTDIYFSFNEIKQGRKIAEIVFTIYSNNTVTPNSKKLNNLGHKKEDSTLNPIYDLIKKLIPNIADSKLREILTTYEMAQVFNAVAIVEKYKTKDTDADLAGLFVSALKQGWNNQSTSQPAKQQSSPTTPTAQPLQTEVTAPPRADNSAVLVTFLELPEPEQQQLITEFLQSSHVNEFVVDKWNSCKKHRENPLDKPLIKGVFIKFLLEK